MAKKKGNSRNGITSRFEGDRGRILLKDVIQQSNLFHSISEIDKIIRNSELIVIEQGKSIIEQNGEDNDIFLIISGKFDVVINGRIVANRLPVAHVGEMSLIDPTAKRSATVVATEASSVLKIKEKIFASFADKHPTVWRQIAIELSKRLKERSKFIKEPRSEPIVFIASSSECLTIVREIQTCFGRDKFTTKPWTDNVFVPTKTPIEDLVNIVKNIDFGIVILADEDVVRSRKKQADAPRDNVIFELGMLIGAIGRERTFIVSEENVDLKIPSDLIGVNHLKYKQSSASLQSKITPVCNEIRKIIYELGSI